MLSVLVFFVFIIEVGPHSGGLLSLRQSWIQMNYDSEAVFISHVHFVAVKWKEYLGGPGSWNPGFKVTTDNVNREEVGG